MAIAFFVMAVVFVRLILNGKNKPRNIGFFVFSTVVVIIGGLGAIWLMFMDSGIK